MNWWERRSGQWNSFDPDPAISYYKFLRAVYQMEAQAAWDMTKRTTVTWRALGKGA